MKSYNLISIHTTLVDAHITLEILSKLSQSEINQLIQELKLPMLQKFKFENAINKLTTTANTIATELKVPDDSASVHSSVSSITAPYCMNDPLIVMMGIGKYDGLPDLLGVTKDYDNVINTFVNEWNYKTFYQLNDNTTVYSNNINKLKRNYKLEWNSDEIELFIEQARKCIVQNRHDGLLFGISSHGDTGKVLYDSNCEKIELDFVFTMLSPQVSTVRIISRNTG